MSFKSAKSARSASYKVAETLAPIREHQRRLQHSFFSDSFAHILATLLTRLELEFLSVGTLRTPNYQLSNCCRPATNIPPTSWHSVAVAERLTERKQAKVR